MKLSMAAELAVRGMITLCSHHGDGPVPLEEICRSRALPKDYMIKIFGTLGRANLVSAVRGKKGGYVLGRLPKEITLLDIVEAIEGPIAVNLCQYDPPRCDQDNCAVRPIWTKLQKEVREALGGQTLADLVCKE